MRDQTIQTVLKVLKTVYDSVLSKQITTEEVKEFVKKMKQKEKRFLEDVGRVVGDYRIALFQTSAFLLIYCSSYISSPLPYSPKVPLSTS